jgi:hypothetical protein
MSRVNIEMHEQPWQQDGGIFDQREQQVLIIDGFAPVSGGDPRCPGIARRV